MSGQNDEMTEQISKHKEEIQLEDSTGLPNSSQDPIAIPSTSVEDSEISTDLIKGTVLGMLDNSKKQKFHLTTILVSGIGFFTDSYDIFVISLVIPMIQYIYFDNKAIPPTEKGILTASSLVGTLIGQALFGYLGDRLGRKKVYGLTLIIMSICAVGSAFSFYTPSMSIVASLSIWRVMLGIGIGGDYPLSAVLTSEYANVHHRGAQIAAVFAMQGFGILFGAATILILLEIFPTPDLLDYVWRFSLAVGVIPAMITAYFRFQIPETPRFLMNVKNDYTATIEAYNFLHKDAKQIDLAQVKAMATTEKAAGPTFLQQLWASSLLLTGTAVTWFLLDVAFYSQSLFQPSILASIQFFTNSDDIVGNIRNLALGQFCIALLGTVPGYWVTVALVDRMGRRTIQLMGFAIMAVLYIILAAAFTPLTDDAPVAFVILYALTFFFTNFGPNATTFIIPSEIFPTAIRSTAHGISAACGKSGAILGAFGFAAFSTAYGLPATMGIFVGVLALGFLVSWFLTPETAQKSLEELEATKTPVEEYGFFGTLRFKGCNCWIPLHTSKESA